ncbi:MAG TPA: prepilin-type N-terminal cleavage/methylation domain-containing protein [Candidatus Hydrogenedens sp.]|nr:prepilin-type N-terminal cleavage/methylation domain-containing protein [Candidatus Hydrogenedens sp.]HOK08421.1 prepilin-type N-terminal cleavage/methylation domain-containing protein [Candidatus Hydrogenedens sp.]HOL19452.1 prepilin-type N-terminal cleavage/methylation domain-containing protein [Candidatus Hydrogenedens sp.]HPP58166.1 prepilin-type N-terminal cleavage/methylation domain-containing protein [Candidatus Hydrogenedens sp.]
MKRYWLRNKRYLGFTLMEILTALAILGGAAFILFNVHYNAMKLHEATITQTDENQLIYAACSRAEVGVLTGTLEESGDFGPAYEGYSWNYIATAIGSDPSIPLYTVNVNLMTPSNENKTITFLCYDLSVEGQTNNLTGGTTQSNSNRMSNSVNRTSGRSNTMYGR